MNRAWVAVAGLVAVGAAAVVYQARPLDWPDGPVYVTEAAPLTASECRGWQSRAERRAMAGFAGSWEAYEGFSHLQGACHPRDQDRGRVLIEVALAKGAGRHLVVEYVLALRAVGDNARADAEFPLASQVILEVTRWHQWWFPWTPSIWKPLFPAVNAELRIRQTVREWAPLQVRLDHLLARPPWVPDAEQEVIVRILMAMQAVAYPEALFQAYRAVAAGRYIDGGGWAPHMTLRRAAACGHPEAIRLYARQVIAGETPSGSSISASSALLWLHAQTNAEDELLREFGRRFPWYADTREREIRSRAAWIASSCGERRD